MVLDNYGVEMTDISKLIGRGRNQVTMAEVEIEKAADYASADADFTERLRRDLSGEIADMNLDGIMDRYELPLVPVLVRMQRYGVAVDVDLLKKMSVELGADLDEVSNRLYKNIGREFNLNFIAPTPGRAVRRAPAAQDAQDSNGGTFYRSGCAGMAEGSARLGVG